MDTAKTKPDRILVSVREGVALAEAIVASLKVLLRDDESLHILYPLVPTGNHMVAITSPNLSDARYTRFQWYAEGMVAGWNYHGDHADNVATFVNP